MITLENGRKFDSYGIAEKMHEAAKEMDFFDYEDTDDTTLETLEDALYNFANLAHYQPKDNYLSIVADVLITLFGEG